MGCFKKKRDWLLLLVPVLAAALLLIGGRPEGAPGATDGERRKFLESYGWEVGEAYPREPVRIPAVFDAVYEEYNALQLEQGFDLRKYAGKEVERAQYAVTNHPNYSNEIRANLLIFNGKIIGGDVCSVSFGGFMHGFSMKPGENG